LPEEGRCDYDRTTLQHGIWADRLLRNGIIETIASHFPYLFPAAFVGLWFLVTTFLGAFSGWYTLMTKYPDRTEEPILRIRGLSGSMGGVGMRGILSLSACPSGLRVHLMRLFGLFCRDFFVPWQDIHARRTKVWFSSMVELQFGTPPVGRLRIPANAATRLATAASERWPVLGEPQAENRGEILKGTLKQWALFSSVAALFFIVIPRAFDPSGNGLPILFAVLFPAIGFGIIFTIQYFVRLH